jgi:hypothetical protein
MERENLREDAKETSMTKEARLHGEDVRALKDKPLHRKRFLE